MRIIAPMTFAALALVAAPAVAQNTDAAAPSVTTAPAPAPTAEEMNNAVVVPPATETPGLTAGPGAAPETVAQGSVDTAYGEPTPVKRSGFPWGVLGLLGLLGLIPRKKSR